MQSMAVCSVKPFECKQGDYRKATQRILSLMPSLFKRVGKAEPAFLLVFFSSELAVSFYLFFFFSFSSQK